MDEFHALYTKYAPDVFRFSLYLCGDRHDAEDITSETFVRAWTAPGEIRMATVKGYLLTIARNLFLQGLRRKSRQVPLDMELRDPAAGPQALAEAASELQAVIARLQELPEVDRAALIMRATSEMPYEEIARALGISLASVKIKIHRGRLKLAGLREPEP
jgi:RNA polymerase sigma-70 factor (ECF subfamily)